MTKQKLIVGGLVALGAWLLFRGEAGASEAPAAKPTPPIDKGRGVKGSLVNRIADEIGIVGSVTFHEDGSVTETEQNFWAGTPKTSRTYSAEEWASRDAALEGA